MFNQPFMMPGYGISSIPLNTARVASTALGGRGLFSRLGGLFGGLRGINWGGFINNASKTLGIINQSIPLVRQIGPMVGNMKSMLKIASVFKDETDSPNQRRGFVSKNNQYNKNNNIQNRNYQDNKNVSESIEENKEQNIEEKSVYNNYPTFFINN